MQNGDLFVRSYYYCDDDGYVIENVVIVHQCYAKYLDLNRFTHTDQMFDWVCAAYHAYGFDKLDSDHITNLVDLFGQEFSDSFEKRRSYLHALEMLEENETKLRSLQEEIYFWKTVRDNNLNVSHLLQNL